MGELIKQFQEEQMFINSIEFGADSIMIAYQERHNQSESTSIMSTMIVAIDTEERAIVYEELQEALRELVDDGYINLRNPAQEL